MGSTDQACSRDSYLRIKNCMNIDGMLSFSSKSFSLISAGPQKPQKLTASKIKYEIFNSSLKNGHVGALIFQKLEFSN